MPKLLIIRFLIAIANRLNTSSPPHRLLPPRPMGTRVSHPSVALQGTLLSSRVPSMRCRAPSPPYRLTVLTAFAPLR